MQTAKLSWGRGGGFFAMTSYPLLAGGAVPPPAPQPAGRDKILPSKPRLSPISLKGHRRQMQNLNKSRAYQHHVSAMPDLHPPAWCFAVFCRRCSELRHRRIGSAVFRSESNRLSRAELEPVDCLRGLRLDQRDLHGTSCGTWLRYRQSRSNSDDRLNCRGDSGPGPFL